MGYTLAGILVKKRLYDLMVWMYFMLSDVRKPRTTNARTRMHAIYVHLCFRSIDSTMSLLSKSEIANF